jgi:hypothetical protein
MMDSINDIKIIGMDEERLPRIRKEAYIDLFFMLSHKAPLEWCEDFNSLGSKLNPSAKIDKIKGVVIETWVKDMDLIAAQLEKVKKTVLLCNLQYIDKMRLRKLAAASKDSAVTGMDGQQNRLNALPCRSLVCRAVDRRRAVSLNLRW